MSGFRLAEQVSLQGRNTFRVSATAELMADVRVAEALPELMAQPWVQSMPLLVLGEGSNILLAGDVPGLTLCMTCSQIAVVDDDGDTAMVRADAGVVWNDLVHWSVGKGFSGLENMALIPGTVGACPIQNIGAYGAEVAEFIESVEVFDRSTGQARKIQQSDCEFSYRDSVFKQDLERRIITAVNFRLPRQRELRLHYAGVIEELNAMGVSHPRPTHVAEAISRIRSRKLPNPTFIGNAGSFFKNPQIATEAAEAMKTKFADLPVFAAGDESQRKISAAWLIEQAGWKGYREGDAGVSAQHSLVLVNHGNASGSDILNLAKRIMSSVSEKFGINLEPEPRIIGSDSKEISAH